MNSEIKPSGPDAALEALDPLVWVRDQQVQEHYGGTPLTSSRVRNLDTG